MFDAFTSTLVVVLLSAWVPAPSGTAKAITFDDIQVTNSVLTRKPIDALPERIRELDGRQVQIRGYLCGRSFRVMTATNFVLVRDSMEGAPSPASHNIAVIMADHEKVRFTVRPVTIVGKFEVTEAVESENAGLTTFYRLSDARLVIE